ncbi:uncharacterized protein BO66DRAFT_192920 [Aspergillus aculeatinus CBS 121060]|uniref:Uncharacterized protein n=1 Tax=Aspergillus aculeatinus CBS 121060 TaxID=1448322 RepID=A0ACD1GXD7_9EURO|nr:hypothetical protein BO66DRAFT_192920 [Aspergillus aculeatinus CBS 121060]RAH66010.1 hypothetical protein BO66DRAFT_192920 [Aspergillus aculeatinus CBS 121060]
MDQQYQGLNNRLEELGQLLLTEKLPAGQLPGYSQPSPDKESTGSSHQEMLRVQFSHSFSCRSCPCVCHRKQKARMTIPGVMESLFGKIFVGYTGLPVLKKRCDFRGCKDQQTPAVTMEYWLPWWFMSMNLRFYLRDLAGQGPQLQLSTSRRVPDNAQSVIFAMQGNIEGLKYLFSEGLATPRDVSNSRGFTLVRWALYGGMHQYETVQFLIGQGAIVDEE